MLSGVKKTVLLYGLVAGILIAVLQVVEYRYLVLTHSFEIYGGILAVLFSSLGIWLGLKLTKPKEVVKEVPVLVTGPFTRNEARVAELGITRGSSRSWKRSPPGGATGRSPRGSS